MRANISTLRDALNQFILDVGARKYGNSEKEEIKALVLDLRETIGDRSVLLMFDRNYLSLEFADFLEKSGVKYLIWLHSVDFSAERTGMSKKDEWVELAHTSHQLRVRKNHPDRALEMRGRRSTRVRIVKVGLGSGEGAAFMTNPSKGSASDIKRLCKKRRSTERKCHALKNKLNLDSVTGKASACVKQGLQGFWADAGLQHRSGSDNRGGSACRKAGTQEVCGSQDKI